MAAYKRIVRKRINQMPEKKLAGKLMMRVEAEWAELEQSQAKRPAMKSKKQNQNAGIEAWVMHPGATTYFSKSFAFKLDILACMLTGGVLADVARKHGLTRGAASKPKRLAEKAYGDFGLTSKQK